MLLGYNTAINVLIVEPPMDIDRKAYINFVCMLEFRNGLSSDICSGPKGCAWAVPYPKANQINPKVRFSLMERPKILGPSWQTRQGADHIQLPDG